MRLANLQWCHQSLTDLVLPHEYPIFEAVTSLAFEQCLSVLPNKGDEWVAGSAYY